MALWSEQMLAPPLREQLLYTRNKLSLHRWFAHPPDKDVLFLDPAQVSCYPPLQIPQQEEEQGGPSPSSSSAAARAIAPKYFIFPMFVSVNSCEFDRE
eukprot:664318-Hanusia_phi.AAC.3